MKCNTTIRFLRDIADIQTGPFGSQLHKEDYVEYGTPIVTVEHLGNRQFTEQNLPKVSDLDKERLKKYVLATGDIVFSRVGSVDRCSYVDEEHNGWMFSGRCLRVRPSEYIHPLYLYYYFCREETRQFVRNIAVGATMPSINTKLLGEVPIAVPDMKIQKTVSNILSTIDDKIELNNKINANLQQQAQAIFKSWFVDFEPFQDGEFVESELGAIPKGWKVISLENVCSVITKGTTPTTLKRRFTDYGINYIKAESISNAHFIDKNKIAYIDQETHELLSRSKIQENDILFTIAGTLGRFCMVDKENVPANTNQAVAIIRADISKIHPCVLYSYFLGDWHTEYCHTRVQQAVQANLSLGTLKNMQIPYPDEVTMEKYRSIVEPLIAEVQRTNRENVASENLRNALIPKLMNGEIDVEGVAD